MRVKCLNNTGANLSDAHLRSGGFFPTSQFDLSLGNEYTVYAMCIWKTFLMYLLSCNVAGPNWYPVELFTVACDRLAPTWVFAFWGQNEQKDVKAVWGYEELVRVDGHFDLLSEGATEAIQIFEKRRVEIEAAS